MARLPVTGSAETVLLLPLKVMLFVTLAPAIAGISTCSRYGPEEAVTLKVTGAEMPQELMAAIAALMEVKLVPEADALLSMVYVPANTLQEFKVTWLQLLAALGSVVLFGLVTQIFTTGLPAGKVKLPKVTVAV